MSTEVLPFELKISDWPAKAELYDLSTSSNSKAVIEEFLCEEFDTEISFTIGEIDFLSGYPEAFILPLHAFLRSVSGGLKALIEEGESEVSIYLQQYNTKEGDPSHKMQWSLNGTNVNISFQWGGQVEVPAHLKELGTVTVTASNLHEKITSAVNAYSQKIVFLLGGRNDWQGDAITTLFEGF